LSRRQAKKGERRTKNLECHGSQRRKAVKKKVPETTDSQYGMCDGVFSTNVRKETEESSEDKELGREGRKIRNWMRKPE
jgi:hypothetical protein